MAGVDALMANHKPHGELPSQAPDVTEPQLLGAVLRFLTCGSDLRYEKGRPWRRPRRRDHPGLPPRYVPGKQQIFRTEEQTCRKLDALQLDAKPKVAT